MQPVEFVVLATNEWRLIEDDNSRGQQGARSRAIRGMYLGLPSEMSRRGYDDEQIEVSMVDQPPEGCSIGDHGSENINIWVITPLPNAECMSACENSLLAHFRRMAVRPATVGLIFMQTVTGTYVETNRFIAGIGSREDSDIDA